MTLPWVSAPVFWPPIGIVGLLLHTGVCRRRLFQLHCDAKKPGVYAGPFANGRGRAFDGSPSFFPLSGCLGPASPPRPQAPVLSYICARLVARLNANHPSPVRKDWGFAVWASPIRPRPSSNGSNTLLLVGGPADVFEQVHIVLRYPCSLIERLGQKILV